MSVPRSATSETSRIPETSVDLPAATFEFAAEKRSELGIAEVQGIAALIEGIVEGVGSSGHLRLNTEASAASSGGGSFQMHSQDEVVSTTTPAPLARPHRRTRPASASAPRWMLRLNRATKVFFVASVFLVCIFCTCCDESGVDAMCSTVGRHADALLRLPAADALDTYVLTPLGFLSSAQRDARRAERSHRQHLTERRLREAEARKAQQRAAAHARMKHTLTGSSKQGTASGTTPMTPTATVAAQYHANILPPYFLVASFALVILVKLLKRFLRSERPASAVWADPGMPSSHAALIAYFCWVAVIALTVYDAHGLRSRAFDGLTHFAGSHIAPHLFRESGPSAVSGPGGSGPAAPKKGRSVQGPHGKQPGANAEAERKERAEDAALDGGALAQVRADLLSASLQEREHRLLHGATVIERAAWWCMRRILRAVSGLSAEDAGDRSGGALSPAAATPLHSALRELVSVVVLLAGVVGLAFASFFLSLLRVVAHDHTEAQVVVGYLLGAAAAVTATCSELYLFRVNAVERAEWQDAWVFSGAALGLVFMLVVLRRKKRRKLTMAAAALQ